jgi:hypothetical protein
MASRGALVVRFVGDTRDLSKSTVRVSKSLGGVSKLGKGLAIGVAAVAGAVGAVAVATTKDLIRVERLGAQTEAVIKATGGAAGRTRSQVDKLAGRLEKMSGAEAETVTEGQNMLLTFKNIKGKQFDGATRAMLDMGVAMNKGSLEGLDLSKTSIQMGKALNDPIKGITALSKVGVSFSDKQKKQIKTMQEAGNIAGAQGVILKELKGEFGGAAKAAGQTTEGMFAKIKNTWGNIAEGTLSFILPMLQTLMTWVNQKVMPALSRFGDWLSNDGAAHLKKFGMWLKDNVLPPLKSFAGFLGGVAGWLGKNADFTKTLVVVLGTAVGIIGAVVAAMKVWAAVQAALNFVMAANPIGIVIVAVAALVAGLVFFFTKTKTGQKIVKNVWGAIKSAIKGVSDWWTKTAWPAVKGALKAMGDWFRMVGRVAKRAWKGMGDALGSTWRWIKKQVIDRFVLGLRVWALIFKTVGAKVKGIWSSVGAALGRVWKWIKANVFERIGRGLSNMRDKFRSAKDRIAGIFGSMRDRLGDIGSWIRKNVFERIRSALTIMKNAFRTAKDGIGKIWDGLKAKAAKPVNFLIKWVWNKGLRTVLNAIPGVDLPEVKPIKFAKGGAVSGGVRGKDSVPAMYMPGEHVWTAKEVRKVGGQTAMYGMRKAALEGRLEFAGGGALSSEAIARAQSFARQQSGKPYGWGAVGPSSYDCSGFMSALTNVIQGQPAYRRRGATADFPWPGFKKGPGQFTIGSTPNYGGSGIGHMAGNLAGLGVESRGGRGVILGSGAMPTRGFPQEYHLGQAGKGGGGGSWWDNITSFVNAMKKLPGQIQEMMSSGSWISTFLRKIVVAVSANVAKFINDKIPNGIPFVGDNPIKPIKLANGGVVRARPGGTHAIIGEGGRDEAVIPLNRGAAQQNVVTVNLDGAMGREVLRLIRAEVRKGGGNPTIVLSGGRLR